MNCGECGFVMWSDEAKKRGVHPECVDEIYDAISGMDAEEILDTVFATPSPQGAETPKEGADS